MAGTGDSEDRDQCGRLIPGWLTAPGTARITGADSGVWETPPVGRQSASDTANLAIPLRVRFYLPNLLHPLAPKLMLTFGTISCGQ